MTSKKIDCRVCGGDGHVAPYNDTQNTGPLTSVCPACKGSGRELRGTKKADRWLEQASTETLERIVNSAAGNEIKDPTPEYPLGGLAHIDGVGRVSLADMREELGRRSEPSRQGGGVATTSREMEAIVAAVASINEHTDDCDINLTARPYLTTRVEIVCDMNDGSQRLLFSGTLEQGLNWIIGFGAALGHTDQLKY